MLPALISRALPFLAQTARTRLAALSAATPEKRRGLVRAAVQTAARSASGVNALTFRALQGAVATDVGADTVARLLIKAGGPALTALESSVPTKKNPYRLHPIGSRTLVRTRSGSVLGSISGTKRVRAWDRNDRPLGTFTRAGAIRAVQQRSNPAPDFDLFRAAVEKPRGEAGQVNAAVRFLVNLGMSEAKAAKPEVFTGTIDGASLRIYVWRESPFGDAVVLATGRLVEPAVRLGSAIANTPEDGFYLHLGRGESRALEGAKRTAKRTAQRQGASATKRATKPKPSAVRKAKAPRRPKAPVQVAAPRAEAPSFNESRALEQAQGLIAALRAMRGAK